MIESLQAERFNRIIKRIHEESAKSNCKRTRTGCIIIKIIYSNLVEISCGFNISKECFSENSKCKRQNYPSGERYDLCKAIHAEQMAVGMAARIGNNTNGAALYMISISSTGSIVVRTPCETCCNILREAGINTVYVYNGQNFEYHYI